MKISRLAWALILLGVALRLWGFFTAGSLWFDELYLVESLRTLSLGELTGPLPYNQSAPAGWLIVQKLWSTLVGDGERALRTVSLLSSVGSLPLTFLVARRVLGQRWALIPLATMAASPFVLWQALQFKPYSSDVFIALALVVLSHRAVQQPTASRLGLLAFVGGVSVTLSLPATFVLIGCGLVFALHAWTERHSASSPTPSIVALLAIWASAVATNYLLLLRHVPDADWLVAYWADGFFPWPLDGLSDLVWFPRVVSRALEDPTGFLGLGWVLLPIAALGLVLLLTPRATQGRPSDPMAARLLLSPALITFGAAVVAVYPFERRLILFLVPALATMLALGLRHLASSRRRGVAWAGRAGVGALAIPLGVTLLWIPHGGLPLASDSRGLFAALEAELEDGDAVVVDYDTEPALRYYGTALSVEPVVARNPRGVLERAAGISEALRRAGPGPTWVAIARVQETSAPPIRSAIPSDLAAGRWWFPTVWEWFAEGLRGWDLLETVEENLDENWRITARIQLHGAALLRLEPVD